MAKTPRVKKTAVKSARTKTIGLAARVAQLDVRVTALEAKHAEAEARATTQRQGG